MFTVFVAETVTGKVIGTLPCVIRNWARVLNGADTAQVDLNPGTLVAPTPGNPGTRDNYRLITTPWRSSLIIDWDGVPVWAGPISERNFDGATVQLSAVGIKAVLNSRKVHTWTAPYASQVITYSGISLGQIAISLVNLTLGHGTLPIVVPGGSETSSDPAHVRTYNGYELKDVGRELDNLTGSLNGPDIDFLPQWTDGTRSRLQWVMRVGTLTKPALASMQSILFDASSPKGSVQKLKVVESGALLATTQWANGAGSTVGTAMSRAQSTVLTSQGWPLLERQTDYKTVSTQGTLDAHAQADLTLHQAPTTQWTLDVNALLPPALDSYLLGDNALVRVAGHLWVPDSPPAGYQMRIIGVSGDGTPTVTLDMQ